VSRKAPRTKVIAPKKTASPESETQSLCDRCTNQMPVSEAVDCDRCGMVCCNHCEGEHAIECTEPSP